MILRQFFVALVLIGTTAVVTQVVSQDGGKSAEEEMMQKWMEFMTPGAPHQEILNTAGSWSSVSEFWTAPGTPAQKGAGSSTITPIMDGRYVVENNDATAMGMPYQGLGIRGYDNLKKKYVAIWADSMSTGILMMEGTEISPGHINYRGTSPDVMSGEYVPVRFVEKKIDNDNFHFEMYAPGPDGAEFLTMRMHYTRSGAKSSN